MIALSRFSAFVLPVPMVRRLTVQSNIERTVDTVWKNACLQLPPCRKKVLFADENKVHLGKLIYLHDEAQWAVGDKYWSIKYCPYWTDLPKHPLKGI